MTKVVLAAALAGVMFSQQAQVRTESRQVPGEPTATVQSVQPPELERRKLAEAHLLVLRESLASQTRTVERGPCNMPIVRANPAVDPKMVVPLRTEGVDAKIRVIEPGVCGKLAEKQIR
jgi:hypothetical protein